MSDDRNSLKYKQIEKYLMPMQIDAKVILQAFKIQQNRRLLSSNRAKQFAVENKIEEQVTKVDMLRVTGKELHSSPESYRIKSHRKDVKNIKLVLDNPLEKIVDAISHDPESKHYRRELGELKKLTVSSPKEVFAHFDRNVYSQKDLDSPYLSRMSKQLSEERSKKDGLEYYEQMILNNPVLFKKIMVAYNASKRQLERESKANFRKFSQRRETTYESKMMPKLQLNELPKNADRKNISFMQYREFQLALNLSNRIIIFPQQDLQYKAFIGKGNNSALVKSILKTRPWWSIRTANELDSCNLVWTEWKRTKMTNNLPSNSAKFSKSKRDCIEIMMNSKKREYLLQMEKKIGQLRKVIKNGDELWHRFDRTAQFDSYLNFTNRVLEQKFEDIVKKTFSQGDYTFQTVQKEHRMGNHIPGCLQLHSKKLLFLNMKDYYQKQGKDIFTVLPLTFHITKGVEDPEFIKFTEYYEDLANRSKTKGKTCNIWILKPGQNSNRGNGISVLNTLPEIKALTAQKCTSSRTLIIQRYFESPFLYNKRKFDIRCYTLITCINGIVKGYWYEQGYIRTASKEFSLKNLENKFIHLTNDAIQKKGEEYGKFENFNKISYADFEKYLEINYAEENFRFGETLERMKQIAVDLILSTAGRLNPKRREYTFEIFGLDYMLDDRLNPFLIEANSNPCIEVDGNVLSRVIPSMLENVIRVAVDPVFPPPYSETIRNKFAAPNNTFEANKLVLVYDSYEDESKLEGRQPEKQGIQEEGEEGEGQIEE